MYKSITTRNQSLFLTIFKTLQTAKEFRHTGLSIVGDFYKKGLVSEDNKKEVIKIGNELKEIPYLIKEATGDNTNG